MRQKMSNKNNQKLFIEISEDLRESLKAKSEAEGTTVSSLVRKILNGYFDRQRNKKGT